MILFMTLIITAITLVIIYVIYHIFNVLPSRKSKDVFHQQKRDNSRSIIRWLYSEKHPQQKYCKNIYRTSDERYKELEIERIKKDRK